MTESSSHSNVPMTMFNAVHAGFIGAGLLGCALGVTLLQPKLSYTASNALHAFPLTLSNSLI